MLGNENKIKIFSNVQHLCTHLHFLVSIAAMDHIYHRTLPIDVYILRLWRKHGWNITAVKYVPVWCVWLGRRKSQSSRISLYLTSKFESSIKPVQLETTDGRFLFSPNQWTGSVVMPTDGNTMSWQPRSTICRRLRGGNTDVRWCRPLLQYSMLALETVRASTSP